jgi:hypothetical protein
MSRRDPLMSWWPGPGDPGLMGLTRWSWAGKLALLGARGRAWRILTAGIDELASSARLRSEDTSPAEGLGFLHLSTAQCAARDKRSDDAQAHLAEAATIAARDRRTQRVAHAFRSYQCRGVAVGGWCRARRGRPGLRIGHPSAARRQSDPAPGHRRPVGCDPNPQRSDRPGPATHPGSAGPPAGMGTGQPPSPASASQGRVNSLCMPAPHTTPSKVRWFVRIGSAGAGLRFR